MLRSYKEIADRISKIWGISVGIGSVIKWSKQVKDPLPVRRIRPSPDAKRVIVVADTVSVDRWAQRRVS